MSRVVTPPTASPTTSPQTRVPHDKIASRAYDKWVQRGRPHQGSDLQDWLEAEAELRSESSRGNSSSTPTRR